MTQQVSCKWIDAGREPECPPDPRYPDGIDIDMLPPDVIGCKVELPYPAPRCGAFHLLCLTCGATMVVSTAGRADDPKSVRIPCNIANKPQ